MKVIVLNGSPRGNTSVSYHHILFLEKHFKSMDFKYIHISKLINKYKDDLDDVIEEMIQSDLILWSYPVYTFSVPYQLMVFMNKLSEHPRVNELTGKYTTQFSTSKHFYDITAYDYMKLQLESHGMTHLTGYMGDMSDLLEESGRHKMVSFFDQVIDLMKHELKYEPQLLNPVNVYDFRYETLPEPDKKPSKVLVVYNGEDYSETLKHMIAAFENLCEHEVHRLDISNINIHSGCLGCLKCVFIGTCVFMDEFEEMYQSKIQDADVLIYASDIKNHFIHEDFKLIDDRAFYNGHKVNIKSKAMGYLLTGSLTTEENLRMLMRAKAEVGHMAYLEPATNEQVDVLNQIKRLCHEVDYFLVHEPYAKTSFYGVGGMKVFRDLVYSMRGFMVDDHDYYKKHNLYDFPKKHYIKNFIMTVGFKWIRHPKRFKKFSPKLNDYILMKYKDILEDK